MEAPWTGLPGASFLIWFCHTTRGSRSAHVLRFSRGGKGQVRARRGCDLQIAEDGDDQDHVERRWNPGDAGGLVAAAARGLQT